MTIARVSFSRKCVDVAEADFWKSQARSAVAQMNQKMSFGLSASTTVREVLEPFLRYKRTIDKLTEPTLKRYRRVLLDFAFKLSGGAGDIPLEQIKKKMILGWMLARADDGVGKATIAKEVGILKTLGRWCFSNDLCGELSFLLFTISDLPKPDKKFVDASDLFECFRKVAKTDPQVALPLECMARLGVRPAAVCALRWSHVKMPGRVNSGMIHFKKLKKGNTPNREIFTGGHMHDNLKVARDLFVSLRDMDLRKSHPVYTTLRGRCVANPYGWTSASLCQQTRIAFEKHGMKNITPYVVRHSLVTYLKQRGVSTLDVQHYCSHKLPGTQEPYNHAAGTDSRGVVAELQGVAAEDSSFRDIAGISFWD